jgi:hypothetical protein
MQVYSDTSFDVRAYQDASSPYDQPEKHPVAMDFLDHLPPQQRLHGLRYIQTLNSTKQMDQKAAEVYHNARYMREVHVPRPFNGKHVHVTEGTLLQLRD